jgi:hypothetical protein
VKTIERAIQCAVILLIAALLWAVMALPSLRGFVMENCRLNGAFLWGRYGPGAVLYCVLLALNGAALWMWGRAAVRNRELGRKLQHLTQKQIPEAKLNEELARRLAR